MSGKKRCSPFWLVFHSACADFFETCHIYRLRHGKKDECKIKVFVILPDMDRAFCVEMYISSRSFGESRRLLDRKPGRDHRKTRLAPNNATINKWANSKEPGCFAGNRTGQWQTSLGPLRGGPPAGRAAVRPGRPGEVCKAPSSRFGLKRTSLNTILREDLRIHTGYKLVKS